LVSAALALAAPKHGSERRTDGLACALGASSVALVCCFEARPSGAALTRRALPHDEHASGGTRSAPWPGGRRRPLSVRPATSSSRTAVAGSYRSFTRPEGSRWPSPRWSPASPNRRAGDPRAARGQAALDL